MKNIPIFYDEKMAVNEKQPSLSAKKPKLLVDQWLKRNLPIEIMAVTPVTNEQFYLSHDKKHVDDILTLKKANGMQTKSQELSDSLKWTSGSLLCAAKYALKHGLAVSPTSGFHHAEYDKSMGFCTFNGLMITAQTLLAQGVCKKIGILDCDQHYGNGTEDIIEYFNLEDSILHITAQKDYYPLPAYNEDFLKKLPAFLEYLVECDLLIYQAGADCHIADPYGGFLTSQEMQLRDKIVFTFCRENNLPLVWNLAGGYQEEKHSSGDVSIQKVLDLHNTTLQECINVYVS